MLDGITSRKSDLGPGSYLSFGFGICNVVIVAVNATHWIVRCFSSMLLQVCLG